MKILSIDVGVKNLAVCLFHVIDKDTFSVLYWNVIDLENNIHRKCGHMCSKSKDICGKNATYEKNQEYYCKTHAKKTNHIIPIDELISPKLKNMKLIDLIQLCNQYHILSEEQQSEKLLKPDLLHIIEQYTQQHFFNLISDKVQSDLITLGKNMKYSFDDIFSQHTIDLVLVENQISPLANKMKTLQGMIAQYFIMKDVYNIKFVSSKNKLKHFETSEVKSSYSDRKKLSIHICRNIFTNTHALTEHLDFFNNSNKKDDLADSFLQGLVYLTDFKIIHFQL